MSLVSNAGATSVRRLELRERRSRDRQLPSGGQELRKASAFALVEVLVSLAILFAVIFALAGLVGLNTNTTSTNREHLLANKLAQNMLDRYGAYPSSDLAKLFGPGADGRETIKKDPVLNPPDIASSQELERMGVDRELAYRADPSAPGTGYLEAEVRWLTRKEKKQSVRLGRLVMDQRWVQLPRSPGRTPATTELAMVPGAARGAEDDAGPVGPPGPADVSTVTSEEAAEVAWNQGDVSGAEQADRDFQKMMEGMLHEHFHKGDADHHSHGIVAEVAAAAPHLDLHHAEENGSVAARLSEMRGQLAAQEIPDGTYPYTFRTSWFLDEMGQRVESVIYTLHSTGAQDYVLMRETRHELGRLEGHPATEAGDLRLVLLPSSGRAAMGHLTATEGRLYLFEPERDDAGRLVPFGTVLTLRKLVPALPAGVSPEQIRERAASLLAERRVSVESAGPLPGSTDSRLQLGW